MAAKNFNDATTGRKNYYNVAYGALSDKSLKKYQKELQKFRRKN